MKKWNAAARCHGYGSQNTSDFGEQTSSTKGTHTLGFVFHRLQGNGFFFFFIGRKKGDLMTLFLKTCMQIFIYKQCDNFCSFLNIQFKSTNNNQLKKIHII